MITYKGQKTVIGKRFIYEGEVIKYTGKIYGDQYSFITNKDVEYILSESDLIKLKEYNINGEDTNTVKDVDIDNKLKDVIIKYTEQELNLLSDLIAGKETDKSKLNDLYKKEYDELVFLNKYDKLKGTADNISLEAQQGYLKDVNRNVSSVNIITLLTSLLNFMASNKEA